MTEGFFDEGMINTDDIGTEKGNYCVYAGSLDPQYGIDTLISAFSRIDTDCKLRIYGSPAEYERLMLNKEAHGIEFCGLASPSELTGIYRKAKLLINPRPSNIPYSKYACPSKTFEYLASGTPAVMCRLPGIPDEYFQYVYTFDDESEDGYMEKIKELLSLPEDELYQKGALAAKFLKEEKSAHFQVSKILSFIIDGK